MVKTISRLSGPSLSFWLPSLFQICQNQRPSIVHLIFKRTFKGSGERSNDLVSYHWQRLASTTQGRSDPIESTVHPGPRADFPQHAQDIRVEPYYRPCE